MALPLRHPHAPAARSRGRIGVLQPSGEVTRYSPEYNPIERCWSKMKNELRTRAAGTLHARSRRSPHPWSRSPRKMPVVGSPAAATSSLLTGEQTALTSRRGAYRSCSGAGCDVVPQSREHPTQVDTVRDLIVETHLSDCPRTRPSNKDSRQLPPEDSILHSRFQRRCWQPASHRRR